MASVLIAPYGSATITVPVSSAVATYGAQAYSVTSSPAYANYPTPRPATLFNSTGLNTTSAFTTASTVVIQAGGSPVTYNYGTVPVLFDRSNYQPTPGTLNATGTLTSALILGGIVTSTTAAAVAATLDTGAILDATNQFAVGDAFDWSAINTGGTNAFTVTASAGHTVVGTAAVAALTTGRFRTLKTAAATFVTYRIS